jgi:AmpD protein
VSNRSAHGSHALPRVSSDGWLEGIRHVESPNYDERPSDADVSLLVVHAISLPPAEFGSDDILRLFINTLQPEAHPYFMEICNLRVSAHFLIRRDGELIQFVSCCRRAWHAGVSSWRGRERCNDYSIGIELEGCDELPFDEAQYLQLVSLVGILKEHFPIDECVGHADISPGRKTDPGPCFDWSRLDSVRGSPVGGRW